MKQIGNIIEIFYSNPPKHFLEVQPRISKPDIKLSFVVDKYHLARCQLFKVKITLLFFNFNNENEHLPDPCACHPLYTIPTLAFYCRQVPPLIITTIHHEIVPPTGTLSTTDESATPMVEVLQHRYNEILIHLTMTRNACL